MQIRVTLARAASLALVLALPAAAGEPPAPAAPAAKVAIDPATGRLRPATAEESAELSRQAARDREAERAAGRPAAPGVGALVRPATEAEALATQRTLADGTVTMMVPESLDSQVVARRADDGTIVVEHAGAAEVGHD